MWFAGTMGVGNGTARAGANIALVKYWGKRDADLNLPATGSISVTVGGLSAIARVTGVGRSEKGRFIHADQPVEGVAGSRMATFLDFLGVELRSSTPLAAEVQTDFPVAAGLASSAAIYCAVTAAAAAACGARITRERLSGLARRGSGSAARSTFGGFVEWTRGERPDGSDSIAHPLLAESAWELGLAIAVVSEERKAVASRDAMEHVARTSPLFSGWVAAQDADLCAARAAIAARDLAALGTIAEENCLRMHATALSSRPPVIYWAPTTLALVHAVRALRIGGTEAYFTIDAGPQVKVLCARRDLGAVADALERVPGVLRVRRATLGPGVEILEGEVPWT